jgi:hypothetical protein
VRSRVLAVANRDAAFASQLARLSAKQLGVTEEHLTYATLASRAVAAGDREAAGRHILRAIDADPTLINASVGILDLAAEDRAAADKLILQYIERLRASQALVTGRSAFRVYFILKELVFPAFNLNTKRTRVAPAGPEVVTAYVYYMAESMSRLEQSEPGATRNVREFVLSTWPLAQAHAPELAAALLELEKLSRRPGDDAAALQASEAERNRAGYEKRVKSALDGGPPDEMTINMAISRGDFTAARKMIDRLEDGPQKTRLTERVNAREALSFASRGDTVEAEKLARQLRDAVSILQVYPVLIDKCAAGKDQSCVITLVYQAMKQLKQADGEGAVALSLSRLAKSVARVNAPLAMEVLDEVVAAANRSNTDPGQGSVGFEADVFRVLAPKGEGRVHQSAAALKDRLSRIVALASVYQSKAGEFAKRT